MIFKEPSQVDSNTKEITYVKKAVIKVKSFNCLTFDSSRVNGSNKDVLTFLLKDKEKITSNTAMTFKAIT
jgi:hypothetical protein